MEISNPEAQNKLSLSKQFELVKHYAAIDNCNDRDKLKDMLKDMVRYNAVQEYHYQELLKKQWGID